MPDHDVGALAETDLLRLRGDGHLHQQRVGAHLRAFRLEMVLGQPEGLVAQPFGENALADLIHQRLLRCAMDFLKRAVINRHAALGRDNGKARSTVVEDSDLQHVSLSCLAFP